MSARGLLLLLCAVAACGGHRNPGAPDPLRMRVPVGDSVAAREFFFDIPMPRDSGECQVYPVLPGGQTVAVHHPSIASTVASETVSLDPAGRIVRYSENRWAAPIPRGPVVSQEQGRLRFEEFRERTRHSTIQVDFTVDRALLMNTGGKGRHDAVSVAARHVESEPRFGSPRRRAKQILARCAPHRLPT